MLTQVANLKAKKDETVNLWIDYIVDHFEV